MKHHRNRLLAVLSVSDRALIEPELESVYLDRRTVLEGANKTFKDVYFMETGVASVVAVNGRDERIEIGLIGCEGMSGTAAIMGLDRSSNSTYMQIPGEALRIGSGQLNDLMQKSVTLRDLLLKFAHIFTTQAAQTAVANGRAKLDQRLARWILMAHDRTRDDDVPLTHDFLSVMLGVRRAGVSMALNAFKTSGLIEARRGGITVLSRAGLEKVAGSFYGVPEAEFRRLIGE